MIWGIVTAGAALLLILVALLHAQRRRNRLEKEMVERERPTCIARCIPCCGRRTAAALTAC